MTVMTLAEQRKYISEIPQEIWCRIHKIATRYFGHNTINGVSADDLVQEAAERCWEEDPESPGYARRKWDREKVNLIGFIVGIIRSLISQIYKKNKQSGIDGEAKHDLSEIPDIDTQYETIMDEYSFNHLKELALTLVQDAPKLYAIFKIWVRDPEMKPGEVANELNMSPEEFYNLRKQLKRKLNVIHEELH